MAFQSTLLRGLRRNILDCQRLSTLNAALCNQARAKLFLKTQRQFSITDARACMKKPKGILERQFPGVVRVYRMFIGGIKDLYRDTKDYFGISKKLYNSPSGSQNLTRREIELYYQIPKDIKKVTPTLIIFALPLTGYIILPLVYFYPRQLVCRHFWTPEQRTQFSLHYHLQRLKHYHFVYLELQSKLENIEDADLKREWKNVLNLLESGNHPSANTLVKCVPLFSGPPFSLSHLYYGDLERLLRLYDMSILWQGRVRLEKHAHYIYMMDMAIIREGGPEKMTREELDRACFIRGLNPINMQTEDIVNWLSEWLAVSQIIDETSWSLLLHCPVLLAYNQPTNRMIINKF